MELKLTNTEFEEPFNKLLKALVESDVNWFAKDREAKSTVLMLGDWSLTLHDNGKWSIA